LNASNQRPLRQPLTKREIVIAIECLAVAEVQSSQSIHPSSVGFKPFYWPNSYIGEGEGQSQVLTWEPDM